MITSRRISVKSDGYEMNFVVIENNMKAFRKWLKESLDKYGFQHCSIKIGAEIAHFHVPGDVWTRDAIDEYLRSIYNQKSEVFIG